MRRFLIVIAGLLLWCSAALSLQIVPRPADVMSVDMQFVAGGARGRAYSPHPEFKRIEPPGEQKTLDGGGVETQQEAIQKKEAERAREEQEMERRSKRHDTDDCSKYESEALRAQCQSEQSLPAN